MDNKFVEGTQNILQKIVSFALDTKFPLMQIQYIGALDYGTVTVNATSDIILKADDTDGDTTTVLTCDVSETPHNTWAKVRDAINATGVFRCFLIGAVPSETSSPFALAAAVTSCRTDNGLTIFYDPDALDGLLGVAITNNKFVHRPTGGISDQLIGWVTDKLVENAMKWWDITITVTGNGVLDVYSIDDTDDTELLILSDGFTSATQDLLGTTNPNDVHIQANRGCRLVVRMNRITAAEDVTAAYVQVVGQSKHVTGGRVVGANYTGCH